MDEEDDEEGVSSEGEEEEEDEGKSCKISPQLRPHQFIFLFLRFFSEKNRPNN